MEVLTLRLASLPILIWVLTSHLYAEDSVKLLQELSPLVESIQKELNTDQQLANVRALLDAL